MKSLLLVGVAVASGMACGATARSTGSGAVSYMADAVFDPLPSQTPAAVRVLEPGQPGECGRDRVGVIAGSMDSSILANVKQKVAELGADGVEAFECGHGLATPGYCAGWVYVCKRANGKALACESYMRDCTAFMECSSRARGDAEHASCDLRKAAAQADGCWTDSRDRCPSV